MAEKHIKWQDVIEVEENSDPANRQKVVKALAFIESSKKGQKLFAELQEAQSHIPEGHLWTELQKITKPQKVIKNADGTLKLIPESVTYSIVDDPKRSLRQNYKKVFFSINHANNIDEALERSFTGVSEAQYNPSFHHIPLEFPEILNIKLSKISKKGSHQLENVSLTEVFAHEIQHAIDLLNNNFNGGEKFSRACLEERAINRENAFLALDTPDVDRRILYTDIEKTFKEQYKNLQLEILLYTSEVFEKIKESIELDAGCKGISDDAAAKKALELMKKHHIPTDKIDPKLLPKTEDKHSEIGSLQPPKTQLSQAKPASDLPNFS